MPANTELKRIAVVGAGGQQGFSIMEALLEYPDQWIIRGIVRDCSLPFSQVKEVSKLSIQDHSSPLGLDSTWCGNGSMRYQ